MSTDADVLKKRKILLGVTGSVATIKVPLLVNRLMQLDFEVRVITTQNALKFFNVSELSVPIYQDLDEWNTWNDRSDPILHIHLRNWADILLIAPLSANTLAKLANGLADNLLTTLARAWWFPEQHDDNLISPKLAYFAPAMNTLMWKHPFTEEHIRKLIDRLGWICIDPIEKQLVCGDYGIGAMAEIETITNTLLKKQLH